MFQPHIILHPTDYSECATYAFGIAVDLARHHGAKLLVLHVTDTLVQKTSATAKPLQRDSPPPTSSICARNWLGSSHPPTAASRSSIFWKKAILLTVIAAVAVREHCDLIVMGTYGRNIFSRLLTGSVTQKLSHLSECPRILDRSHPPYTDGLGGVPE